MAHGLNSTGTKLWNGERHKKMHEIDINTLTERQKEVVLLIESGMSRSEVAKKLGCTYQNVTGILKTISKRAKNPRGAARLKEEYKINLDEVDLNILSPREKEVVLLRDEGKTCAQIAKELNLSANSVGVMLYVARAKIAGRETYSQKNKEKINAACRAAYKIPEKRERKKAAREKFVKNHPEFKEKLSEYNKRYYQEHKEKILLRQRELRDEKRKYQE